MSECMHACMRAFKALGLNSEARRVLFVCVFCGGPFQLLASWLQQWSRLALR